MFIKIVWEFLVMSLKHAKAFTLFTFLIHVILKKAFKLIYGEVNIIDYDVILSTFYI